MTTERLLILGGYGNAGLLIAETLLQYTDVQLILAGRRPGMAKTAADSLNAKYGARATGIGADAADAKALHTAFAKAALVIVAASSSAHVQTVARTALAAGIDYLDLQFSAHKTAALLALRSEIEHAGRCFITDAGFHPGMPAALVRYVAPFFDSLERANVGSVIKIDWKALELSQSTVEEFVAEITEYQPLFFKNGNWQMANMRSSKDFLRMNFGNTFNQQLCTPMFIEEMRQIPARYPSLQETGFFVGGFNWFVDWLVLPFAMVALRHWPKATSRPMARLLAFGLRAFSKPPYGTVLKIEASGQKSGAATKHSVTLSHDDGYRFTAIATVACLRQYLDGTIKTPGLWLMGNVVEPKRLLDDMAKMGIALAFDPPAQ